MRLSLLILCLAALLQSNALLAGESSAEINRVDLQVAKKEAWLAGLKQCPAALLPKQAPVGRAPLNNCKSGLGRCFARCESGDGDACYWLAYAVQMGGGMRETFESLYQRSCTLGVVSGCTNRAAGLLKEKPDDKPAQRCTARTFAKTCAHDDPWGCTMYAFQLARGIGVKADPDLALRMLAKSCKYGEDDPACRNGMTLKEEIQQAKQKAGSAK